MHVSVSNYLYVLFVLVMMDANSNDEQSPSCRFVLADVDVYVSSRNSVVVADCEAS